MEAYWGAEEEEWEEERFRCRTDMVFIKSAWLVLVFISRLSIILRGDINDPRLNTAWHKSSAT